MRFAGTVGGSDEPALTAEQVTTLRRRMNAPGNEIPGAVPFHAVIARNEQLAIALIAIDAYSTGLSLKLAIRLHPSAAADLDADMFPHHPRRGASELLLGVEYPDGRTASTLGTATWPHRQRHLLTDEPALLSRGGGGGGGVYEMEFWLTPAPSFGGLVLIAAWPAQALAESRTVIPASAIAQGVDANLELWPWERLESYRPPPPPPPQLPSGGWFASHQDDASS